MAVINVGTWGFSRKIIDLATAKNKNLRYITIDLSQKYFSAFSIENSRRIIYYPYMYFDTISPAKDIHFNSTRYAREYKENIGKSYDKSPDELAILNAFNKLNFNFKKAPDFKLNYYNELLIEVVISNLLQIFDKTYQSDIYYGTSSYNNRSDRVSYIFKLAIPDINPTKRDYDKIFAQIENIIGDIPNKLITIESNSIKTCSPRKKVVMEDKYEQDVLLDGNGIRIQRGDIVIYHTYQGRISFGRVLANTEKCVKVDSTSVLISAKQVYVIRSGNTEKLENIPWNQVPCDLLDKSESYYL